MPSAIDPSTLDAIIARWGQSIRFAVSDGEPSAIVGMARGHALTLTSDEVIAALTLAKDVLSHE